MVNAKLEILSSVLMRDIIRDLIKHIQEGLTGTSLKILSNMLRRDM